MLKENIEDVALEEFLDLIKSVFPNYFVREWGNVLNGYDAKFAIENYFFQKTDYYYALNESIKFVHWTDLKSLLSILNYREIRLYNLYNSNDRDEFNYSASALGLSENEIKKAKKYYYTFSFCEKDQLNNDHLWEVYGKEYKGVAIEFSIMNDPLKWENYMISKVHYNIPQNFCEFQQRLDILKRKYNREFRLDLNNFIGFNKSSDYNRENEVRIASYFPYTREDEILKYVMTDFKIDPVNKQNSIANYISLHLWEDQNSNAFTWTDQRFDRRTSLPTKYFKISPQIKLENIYFGSECGITYTEFPHLREEIQRIILCNLGYRINMEWDFVNKKK